MWCMQSLQRLLSSLKSSSLVLSRSITSLSKNFKHLSDETMGEQHNFPKEEEKILELWKEIDAFKSCLKQSKGKPRLVFN